MNIKKLALCKVLSNSYVYEQEFDYGGFPGKAELFGFKIVLFRKGDNKEPAALHINEMDDSELMDIANRVISGVGLGVKFGDGINKIKKIYGEPFSTDCDYDTIRCNYLLLPDLFICFGLTKNQLSNLEIINDYEMVSEIKKVR